MPHTPFPSLNRYKSLNSGLFLIWVVFLLSSPFYLFPSGLPQIADFMLILAIVPVVFALFIRRPKIKMAYMSGAGFVLLVILINSIHYVFNPDLHFIKSCFYYLYNFLVFVFIAYLFRRDMPNLPKLSARLILLSALIQLGFIVFISQDVFRETGTFNNPNQLSYWSLLNIVMLFFLRKDTGLKPLDGLSIALLSYIQLISLSRAGIISHGLSLLVLFISPLISVRTKVLSGVVILLGGVILFSLPPSMQITPSFSGGAVIEKVIDRLNSIGAMENDSIEGRGYDRLFEYPIYLFLGAGEGGYEDFSLVSFHGELHSGLATILFSYGFLGLGLFGFFLFCVLRGHRWYMMLFFLPILLYGVTHQNVRFTHFWVLLGIIYAGARMPLGLEHTEAKA